MPIKPQWEEYDDLKTFMAWEFVSYIDILTFLSPALKNKIRANTVTPSAAGCDMVISWCREQPVNDELSKEATANFAFFTMMCMQNAYKHLSEDDLFTCYESLRDAQAMHAKITLILNLKFVESNKKRDAWILKSMRATMPYELDAHVLSQFIAEERQKKLHKGLLKKKEAKTKEIISAAQSMGWNKFGLQKITDEVLKKLNPKDDKKGLSRKTIYRTLKNAGHSTKSTGKKRSAKK